MQIAKRGWVGVLAAVLVAGCGSDSDPQQPPPPPAAVLDWEGTQFANWDAAGNLQTGTQALTFSQDTAVFHGGAASLKVAGMIENQWGTDWIADAEDPPQGG